MKKTVIVTGLTAIGLLMNAYSAKANIGETLSQSNARFGQLWHQYGNMYYYLTPDYLIAELVSPSTGAVEYIEYTKSKGVIGQDERDRIIRENLPPYYLSKEHWKVQVDHRGDNSKDNGELFVSTDDKYALEVGWDESAGDAGNSYLSIKTPVGAREIVPLKAQADLNGRAARQTGSPMSRLDKAMQALHSFDPKP
jgi:hypothetical protein